MVRTAQKAKAALDMMQPDRCQENFILAGIFRRKSTVKSMTGLGVTHRSYRGSQTRPRHVPGSVSRGMF